MSELAGQGAMGSNRQELQFDSLKLAKVQDDDVLYFISGPRMYEIGEVSGKYPPIGWRRPGFLAGKRISEVGPEDPRRPESAAHLLREMGGIWAHPVKAIESLYFSINTGSTDWLLDSSTRFVYHFAYVEFFFERDDLSVTRVDFVDEHEPALFIVLRLANRGRKALPLRLRLDVEFNLMPSWFSGWANGDDVVFYRDGLLFAYDKFWPGQWGVVCGSNLTPSGFIIARTVPDPKRKDEKNRVNTLDYNLTLGAGKHIEVPFLISAESRGGYPVAHERFKRLINRSKEAFKSKVSRYQSAVFSGVQFECSEEWFTRAYQMAKANLLILMADLSPFLGPYLFAGIPEYVQLFGTDTCYSIPGLTASGFHSVAREALSQLGFKASTQCGRVPHEVTTNGRIFHPGNTQETSQFAIAAWKYFKWTGDRSFLEWAYPLCQEGVLDYSPAHWDTDLDYYLDGNSMVERPGMGDEKLDSVCYFCRAIFCLGEMARVLGKVTDAERYDELAQLLKEAINEDFWMESESLFADSLEEDHTQRMDGHWIVAIPMEAGIADRDKGARALERIEKDWLNEWGLVHTRGKEELVWTLANGVLAMAEFSYGFADRGTWLLRQIARTAEFGAVGTLKELIPEGLSFVQLWSPAMFLQGVIEGIFRMDPRADADRLTIRPRLPSDWSYARLKGVRVGKHSVGVDLEDVKQGLPGRSIISHDAGEAPLVVEFDLVVEHLPAIALSVGKHQVDRVERLEGGTVLRLELTLEPGEEAEISLTEQRVKVSKRGRAGQAYAQPRTHHRDAG